MPIDIAAGLSSAGEAVAKTAGAYTLEAQRGELEMQKVKLADELAGAREDKQRGFLTSERVATQDFTKGENVENRKSNLTIAELNAKAHVQAAGITAGGHVAAAQIGATTSIANTKATIDAHAATLDKQIDAQFRLGTKIETNADGTASMWDPKTQAVTPLKGIDGKPVSFQNPETTKAIRSIVELTQIQQRDLASRHHTELAAATSTLKAAQQSLDPKAIKAANEDIVALNQRYEPLYQALNGKITSLTQALGPKTGIVDQAGVIKYDAKGNRIAAPAAEESPTGLINTSPEAVR